MINLSEICVAVVDQNPSIIIITNTKGVIEYVNPQFCIHTGYSSNELIGLKGEILYSDENNGFIYSAMIYTIKSGQVWTGELLSTKKDGTFFWESASISPIFDENGVIINYVKVAYDITVKKENERKQQLINKTLLILRKINKYIINEKNKLDLINKVCTIIEEFEDIHWVWIVLFDEKGNYIASSESGLGVKFIKIDSKLRTGKLPYCGSKFINDEIIINRKIENHECPDCIIATLQKEHYDLSIYIKHESKIYGIIALSSTEDFTKIPVVKEILLEIGGDIGFALMNIELLEQKAIYDRELKQSEEINRSIMQSANDAIILSDSSGRILSWNNSAEKIFGYSFFEIINKNISEVILSLHEINNFTVFFEEYEDEDIENIEGKTIEITAINKSGNTFPAELSLSVWERNNVKHFTSIIRNVTARKESEKALSESERKYRSLIENYNDAVFLLYENEFELVNDKFIEMFGDYTNIANDSNFDFFQIYSLIIKNHYEISNKAIYSSSVNNQECKFFTSSGDEIYLEVSISHFNYKNGNATQGIIRDITARKESERKLDEYRIRLEELLKKNKIQLHYNERKFTAIFEQAALGVALIDSKTLEYAQVNSKFCEITGFADNELYSHRYSDISHPDDIENINFHIEKLIIGEIKEFSLEKRYYQKNGNLIWVNLTASVLLSEEREGINIIVFIKDITQNKLAEKILKENLKKETELNKLKSNFVSTTSHQFRTPLTTIKSNCSLLKMQLENLEFISKPDFLRYLERIDKESRNLNDLMDNILLMSKKNAEKTPFKKDKTDMILLCNKIITERVFDQQFKRIIEFSFSGKEEFVYADPNLITHIITNLLSNAFKYSDTNPKLEVIFAEDEFVITVSDEGIGIPEEVHEHIFSSFYRAENVKTIKGTGLGLIIVKEYVEMHKGTVSFISKVNEGTKFIVKIPYGKENNLSIKEI